MSTLLSLVFVPAFFSIMDSIGVLFTKLFSKVIGPTDEDEPAHALPHARASLRTLHPASVRSRRCNWPRNRLSSAFPGLS